MAKTTAGNGVKSMICPHCGSADTARLQAVFEHGTRDYISDSPAFGITVGGSSSVAAQRASPPPKAYGGTATMLIVIGGLMVLLITPCVVLAAHSTSPRRPLDTAMWSDLHPALYTSFALIPFVPLLAWGIWLRLRAYRYNRTVWPPLYEAWACQWMCRRCGDAFVPGKPSGATPAVRAVPSGPARYRISGVDRASKMETTWHCTASSEANARAKADLEGIVVTGCERE